MKLERYALDSRACLALLLASTQAGCLSAQRAAEFERRLTGIENELLEMRIRGEVFLDDRMRLFNIREMLQGNKLRQAFEAEVWAEE